jgi:Ras family
VGQDIALSIAANKQDLPDRAVPDERSRGFAAAVGAAYYRTSAKTGAGIEQVAFAATHPISAVYPAPLGVMTYTCIVESMLTRSWAGIQRNSQDSAEVPLQQAGRGGTATRLAHCMDTVFSLQMPLQLMPGALHKWMCPVGSRTSEAQSAGATDLELTNTAAIILWLLQLKALGEHNMARCIAVRHLRISVSQHGSR